MDDVCRCLFNDIVELVGKLLWPWRGGAGRLGPCSPLSSVPLSPLYYEAIVEGSAQRQHDGYQKAFWLVPRSVARNPSELDISVLI